MRSLPEPYIFAKAAERGVKITLVIDRSEDQDPHIRNRLLSLHDTYPNNVKIESFSNADDRRLHAKLIVVDRRTAVLGSANLSWAGMTSNYQIAMLVDGSPAWKLASLVDTFARFSSQSSRVL